MAQFYLLSVVTLLLGGLFAASDFFRDRMTAFEPVADLADRRGFAITAGAITAVVGIIKLFLRAPFDAVPVAGDLLPAVAGIATGGVLLLRAIQHREPIASEVPQPETSMIVQYRTPIGFGAMIVGLLHFFFHGAVIL